PVGAEPRSRGVRRELPALAGNPAPPGSSTPRPRSRVYLALGAGDGSSRRGAPPGAFGLRLFEPVGGPGGRALAGERRDRLGVRLFGPTAGGRGTYDALRAARPAAGGTVVLGRFSGRRRNPAPGLARAGAGGRLDGAVRVLHTSGTAGIHRSRTDRVDCGNHRGAGRGLVPRPRENGQLWGRLSICAPVGNRRSGRVTNPPQAASLPHKLGSRRGWIFWRPPLFPVR